MSKLIGGKEVLISLANGDCVMCRNESSGRVTDAKYQSVENILDGGYEYRGEFIGLKFFIKPITIMLNGVEIPAPFDSKDVDKCFIKCFIIDTSCEGWFREIHPSNVWGDSMVWDSEDKIKEVVKAVRNVFNCGDNQC